MATETKHEQLASALRQRIESGDYVDELPSESALVEESGYSRSTVRQALNSLENEGLITGRSGSRRRIKEQKRWTWPMSTWERAHTAEADAWAVSVQEQGGQPNATVTVVIEGAPKAVAAALNIEPGSPVVVRRRVRSVDGEPHQLADSYFPYWLAEQHPVFLAPGDLSAPGGLLAAAGLAQKRCLDEITARMPNPDEATALRAARGVPLLIHSRTGYDKDDRPLRHMVTRMTADRVHVQYELDL